MTSIMLCEIHEDRLSNPDAQLLELCNQIRPACRNGWYVDLVDPASIIDNEDGTYTVCVRLNDVEGLVPNGDTDGWKSSTMP